MADRLRRLLLIHQNFLGQDLQLAQALQDRGDAVVAIGSREARPLDGIPL
ncbi:MAG: hypothetical protein VKK97_07445 [Synechococcaceae cyanobacterium]|nr:hypothetical protein [Synechococcaceae cyanobacterium]